MTVSEKIRKMRGDIKPDNFAKHIGISTSMLYALEAGTRKPGLHVVVALSKFSGWPMEYWIDDKEETK